MDYKEKLRLAKEALESGSYDKNTIEYIFPELKESEDEEVRKELIQFVKNWKDPNNIGRQHDFPTLTRNVEQCDKYLAWLEKQGENKANKMPIWKHWKDGIAGGNKGEQIFLIKNGFHYSISSCLGYECDYIELSELDKLLSEKQGEQKPTSNIRYEVGDGGSLSVINGKPFDYEHATIHQMDFAPKQEPKFHDGDWTVSNLDKKARQISEVHFDEYNSYYVVDGQSVNLEEYDRLHHLWSIEDAKPGDMLVNGANIFIFHFINDTRLMGYCHVNTDDGRFYDDIGKNECFCLIDSVVYPATKEQRDLLFSKMKEAGYEWDDEKKELKKIDNKEVNGEDYGIDSLWHAQRILEKTLGSVDGYQTDDGILEHKCAISAVKKLYEQKPAWSEEDECYMSECIGAISTKDGWSFEEKRKTKHWLKSLKDRYTWKPSNEQLDALHDAAVYVDKSMFPHPKGILMKLYKQLNKLKEG